MTGPPRADDAGSVEPAAHNASLVVCPECGRTDNLIEEAYRPTSQPVEGLHTDGSAGDYHSFEYSDGVIVVGYSCGCGWFDACDLIGAETRLLWHYAEKVLANMPRVSPSESEVP